MPKLFHAGLGALALLAFPNASRSADKCFEFGVRGYPAENFRAVTGDAKVQSDLAAQLKLPEADRRMFPSGPIDSGNGGVNQPWHWHLKAGKWSMTEVSIELCDSWPGYIERNRDAWIANPKTFCPWGGYVLRECPTVSLRPGAADPGPGRGRAELKEGRIFLEGKAVTPAGRITTP